MINNYKRSINKNKGRRLFWLAIFFFTMIYFSHQVTFEFDRIYRGLPSMFDLVERMFHPNWSYTHEVLTKLLETLEIALVSSGLGLLLAVPLACLSARNTCPNRGLAFILNGLFSLLRTVPSLVWAALLVSIFSIGKLPGMMALTLTALLVSMKLLKEHIETINKNTLQALSSLGANKALVLRYAVLPTIRSTLISVFFMVLEINIRSATVLGLVGAGGIGQIMWRDLNHLRYDNLATLILLLFVTILVIDGTSHWIRRGLDQQRWVYKTLFTYRLSKFLKACLGLAMVGFIFYWLLASFDLTLDRMKLGLDQADRMMAGMIKPDWDYLPKVVEGVGASFFIAVFATLSGSLMAVILTYFTAYKTSPNKVLVTCHKLLINGMRTFPPIIMAIIFFRGVGPGPLAGAMALSIYTTGVLTKMYSEVVEASHDNIINSVKVTGADSLTCYRHGVLAHTWPNFLSLVLYRLESNIRNSTILGIVGAGGIGASLTMNITWRNWNRVGLIILCVSLMILAIDLCSSWLRKKYV